ncbi:hypothetical protein PC118_g2249 [Phytophthora cactorum]|uniref:WW domain-containing protein n=1 Tax=Phytophthora cactorum TaxID=29920 RepID=A0A8T1GH48_9STRA|nr:hypothetical protein PC118_g2249 [Phytophthora cactorum]
MANKKARVRKAHDGIRLSSISPEKRGPGAKWRPHTVAELSTVFTYKEIPDEVLVGTELDLSIWSVVASDACLGKLSRSSVISGLASPPRFQLQSNQLADLLPSAASTLALNSALVGVLPKQQSIVRLNLAGADQITDKTAHLIARACPELKHLNLERALKLTDSGILHIVSCCRSLESLNLSYVTALQSPALSCIGELRLPLRSLAIAGCNRVPDYSLLRVFQACSTLESLDLSFCASVTDNVLLTLGKNCCKIRQLKLRGCCQISDTGVVALANSGGVNGLVLLDLARFDLQYKFNDISLLALAENCLVLQTLILSGCDMVSDVGMDWLASGCNALTYLDVSGCTALTDLSLRAISENLTGCPKIRSFSIKSLASSWKFAVYTSNDQFKGMTPRHRAEDWLFIEDYGKYWRAAVHIQCMYRARVARRIAQQKREECLILWVATRLQSVYRGRQARKYAVILRLQFYKETEAATRIQRAYRQLLARRETRRLREIRHHEEILQAARIIQASWRKKRLRERLQSRHLRRLAYEDKLRRSAIRIQRHWRGKRGRERTNLLRTAKIAKEREEFEAARQLQSIYRVRIARRAANLKREELKNEESRRERAAKTLQKCIRRHKARKELRAMQAYVAGMNDAATRIQQNWRSKKKYQANQVIVMVRQKKRENAAAVKLQAAWKRRKARIEVSLMRLARDFQQQKLVDATLMVQTNWRGRHGRLQAHSIKQTAMEKISQLVKIQHDAVTLVQAHYRGCKGREKYREAQLNKKKRWKEITRPENGEKFYYNRVTGEVRFRRPQDVLDLLPKPLCENCESSATSEATMECKDCGELFCGVCWANVHSGGRRKLHEFRALYDYYNRRVDYGDWEFPSRWPSEIEQDEMDGWGFRTHPRRRPDEVQGAWERYVDPDTRREWFYNRETDENSYVAPEGFIVQANGETSATTEWIKYFDETQGVHYYYNIRTQESTFDRPETYATPRISPPTAATSANQDGWEKHVDPQSGYPYYYNRLTLESVFTRPMGFVTGREEDVGLPGWAKYFDAASASYYYYNAQTNESCVDRPDAFATPRISAAEAAGDGGDEGLAEFYDPVTGKAYVFNARTTECRQASAP